MKSEAAGKNCILPIKRGKGLSFTGALKFAAKNLDIILDSQQSNTQNELNSPTEILQATHTANNEDHEYNYMKNYNDAFEGSNKLVDYTYELTVYQQSLKDAIPYLQARG